MVTRSVSWPNTTERLSPQGYGAEPIAYWLLGRHPHLANLLARSGCVVVKQRRRAPDDYDDEDEPVPFDEWPWGPNLEALADQVRVFDEWDRRDNVTDDTPPPPEAEPLAAMTDNEVCQLRLLAMLSAEGPQVGLKDAGMYTLDDAGRGVLADWLEALRVEWADPIWRITGPTP